MRFKHLLKLM